MIEVCHKQKRPKQISLFFNKDVTNVSIISELDSATNHAKMQDTGFIMKYN